MQLPELEQDRVHRNKLNEGKCSKVMYKMISCFQKAVEYKLYGLNNKSSKYD